ncbi:MAG TPA: trypsin-like peptidase domain-containing protein [Gaiellaceae bacterium]|nr:trypsin-like peptidase domain-containing protein [Gaiellaceae bacterium]
MRSSPTAVLVLVAAVLGGAVVLVLARATGVVHGSTRTVFVGSAQPKGDVQVPVVVAKPLAGNGFEPAQIYKQRSSGVVTIFAYFDAGADGGQGSGFVVSKTGTILTSAHVVTTAGQANGESFAVAHNVYVQFADGDRVPAKVVGYDLYDDVAVLHVDPRQHPVAPVPLGRSDRVVVGEPVAAIGSPFGDAGSLTVGVVSAVKRSIPSLTAAAYDLVDAIQTDAPINHGNSGGPLFDARGEVIGINAQISSSGANAGSEGVGFAVPIDSARRSMKQLLATGKVHYAYVGVSTEDLTPSIASHFGYAAHAGALIDSLVPGGPAAAAGLKAGTHTAAFEGLAVHVGGDAIVAIDGIPVRNAEDVVRIVATQLLPGQVARFTVVRGSARRTVRVKLTERPSPAG